jgi:hypothetical protein
LPNVQSTIKTWCEIQVRFISYCTTQCDSPCSHWL